MRARNPSCELFLRHALTTLLLNGMFCGVGLPLRPPETIPSPPQSGPKFKPARYYSTSRVTPSSIPTASHCPEYHLPPLSPPAQTQPHPLCLVHIGRRRPICLSFLTRPACSRGFFSLLLFGGEDVSDSWASRNRVLSPRENSPGTQHPLVASRGGIKLDSSAKMNIPKEAKKFLTF